MIRTLALAAFCTFAAPAFAQAPVEPLPRFDALEDQLQRLEQQEFDRLDDSWRRERDRIISPNSGFTAADLALRQAEYERLRQRMLFEAEQQRARVEQERQQKQMELLNTRIPEWSQVTVKDPERYILPTAPPNTFYARVDGRFVLVDKRSEQIVNVLPVQPTDPTADVPAGPRPMPESGLPARRVAANSSLVIRDFGAMALPAPPSGLYYARVDGQLVLVDARTELPVRLVKLDKAAKPG